MKAQFPHYYRPENQRMESLPFVIPIAGSVAVFTISVSCCFFRWNRRRLENLEDRVSSLERRAAMTPLLTAPIPTVNYPPPIAVTLGAPPPYRPMASAPPAYRAV